jgi:hypothetical protein
MGAEDGLRDALNKTALDLQQHTSICERELEEVLVAHLAESLPGSISRQAPLSLEGWPGVGNCDIAVTGSNGDAPILLELKWGAGTLYNCAWDAVKLASALREGAAQRAYLVAGAPLSDWRSEQRGAELFDSASWDTPAFMDFYAKEFAFWRRDVKTRPEILPRSFSVREICSVDIEIDTAQWQLRCSRVSVAGTGSVRVNSDGVVEP